MYVWRVKYLLLTFFKYHLLPIRRQLKYYTHHSSDRHFRIPDQIQLCKSSCRRNCIRLCVPCVGQDCRIWLLQARIHCLELKAKYKLQAAINYLIIVKHAVQHLRRLRNCDAHYALF